MVKTFLKVGVLAATTLVVLFALALTVVRVGSLFAPHYVENLNRQYADQGFVFSDLRVRWRGINPVVELGSVDSDHVHLESITAELDTLASFLRNTYVFRTVQVEHASFLMSGDSGCSLGFPTLGGTSVGLGSIVRYSKNIDISFSSSVTCGSSHIEHEGFFRTVTLGNIYRLHASIKELGECSTCTVSALYEATRQGIWRRQEHRLLNVQVHDFVLPAYLIGWNFLDESLLNAQLLMNGTSKDATLVGNLELQPRAVAEDVSKLSLDFGFALADAGYTGEIVAGLFDHRGDVVYNLEHVIHRALDARYTHGWSRNFDLGAIGTFMDIFGSDGHPIEEWADGLAPSGILSNLHWLHDRNGLTYSVTGDNLEIQQYAAFPALFLSSAELSGRGTLVQLETVENDIRIDRSRFSTAPLRLASVETSAIATWNKDFFGSSITSRWVPEPLVSEVELRIDYGMNYPSRQQRFHLSIDLPSISSSQLQPLVKSFVPATTFGWIERAVRNAYFEDAQVEFSYSTDGAKPATAELDIRAPFYDAEVSFLDDWPRLISGTGLLHLSENALHLEVESAYTQGNHIEYGTLALPYAEPILDVQFSADMNFLLLQNYLVESPLAELVPFDPLHFDGSGSMDLSATLKIPLSESLQDRWEVELEFLLADVYLDVIPANVQIDDLFGTVGYQFPNQFSSTDLTGKFFERPIALELSTREQSSGSKGAVFAFESMASARTISRFAGDWLQPITTGFTQIHGELVFPFANDAVSTMDVYSDLVGIDIALPQPFLKPKGLEQPVHVHIELDDQVRVDVSTKQLNIQAIEIQDSIWRGSIGFNVAPLELSQPTRQWVVTGSLAELELSTVHSSDFTFPPGLDIEFSNFHIDKLIRGQLQFHDLVFEGTFGGPSSNLTIGAEEGRATLTREVDAMWQLGIEQLRLWHSVFENPNTTAIDPTMFLQLPPVEVTINGLYLFDENGDADEYGSWSFELDTDAENVYLNNIVADFRGVNMDTTDGLGITWDTSKNETRFGGIIKGNNLLNVLPEFDVDAEIESETFVVHSDLVWPGSPFDVNMLQVSGRIHGNALEGSLLEVEAGQGVLRLLGLFNIAPIIQRMDFNPLAMFAKGFNYDRILFDVVLDQSKVIVQEPIQIQGRSSEIKFSGGANLADQSLSMDVVVKLPFTSNLKWYVALITGNPAAFLGTMLGSRIFQPQLDRISSAKYKVEGTFESPEVELIGVFADDLSTDITDDDTNNEE